MELTAEIKKGASFFGDGTFEKPKIKFYFTKPCPRLGIENGTILPEFGKRPAFQCVGNQFSCDLCSQKFSSGVDAVRHWQQEKLSQTDKLGNVDIPSVEVKPGLELDSFSLDIERQENDGGNDVKQYLDVDFHEKQDEELVDEKIDNELVEHEDENADEEENTDEYENKKIDTEPSNYDAIELEEPTDYPTDSEGEAFGTSESQEDEDDDYKKDVDIKLENEDSNDDDSFSGINSIMQMEFKEEFQTPDNGAVNLIENEVKSESLMLKPRNKKNKKVYTCKYKDCDYDTLHGSLLRRHIKHVHELIRYDCTFCDLKGIGRDGLRKHIKRKHKEDHFVLKEHFAYHVPQSDVSEKSEFKCEFENCEFKASNPWLLKRHNRNVHEGVKYDCNFCDLTGLGYEGIRKHMKSKHGDAEYGLASLKVSTAEPIEKPKEYFKEGDDYVCKICNHRAQILDSLRMHIKRKHADKICGVCAFKANDFSSLKEHADAEHGGILYPCKYCEKNLVSEEGLRRHELHYHSEKNNENAELLYCDQCEFQSYGKYQLKRHIQSVHSSEGSFDCSYCEYVGKSRQRVLRHIKTVHEGVKIKRSLTSQCDMCDYRCSGPSKLATHMGAKHGVNGEMFYCDQCDFTSSYITSVNNHKKWKHDGEVYSCNYCEFTTRFKQFLQNHIDNKHLGIKHNCDECDYAGASAQCLISHKNSQHLGIKYPCDQCDYKASQQGSLYLHKKAKHENVRFNCSFCDFSASFKGNLRAHMKKSHESNHMENQ